MKIATMAIVKIRCLTTGKELSTAQGASNNVILPRPGDFVTLDVVEVGQSIEKRFVVESINHKYNESVRPIISILVRPAGTE